MEKLYRTKNNKMVGGVCSGIADYLNVDVSLIRILTLLSIFVGTSGFWIYLIAWAIIPEEPLN